MNLAVVTPPAVEPVTVAQAYEHLRWDTELAGSPPEAVYPLQALVERNIATARAFVEQCTRRALVAQTVRLTLDRFPVLQVPFGRWGDEFECRNGWVELKRPPLIEVESVQYLDAENALQTVDPDDYFVTDDLVPKLMFAESFAPPCTYRRDDAVRVTYRVGYVGTGSPPDERDGIPSGLIDALLLQVQLLSDRFDANERADLERARDALMASYTIHSF